MKIHKTIDSRGVNADSKSVCGKIGVTHLIHKTYPENAALALSIRIAVPLCAACFR